MTDLKLVEKYEQQQNYIENGINQPCVETSVLQSLYFLYQELLKENSMDMANSIENTISVCEDIARGRAAIAPEAAITPENEDIFAQFYILREFRRLSKKQKSLLIDEMENIRDT